eukprot:TRINITY_DN16618_c0_g1_i1.p3 TRINITY_DN16618_c0_g1~~TRINITY_DN16618_c0_g1_i1.p3  ORF type:complete len:143 (+),score=17.62 TRINITY_DN16618_c0_g1_i1:132-560(+)
MRAPAVGGGGGAPPRAVDAIRQAPGTTSTRNTALAGGLRLTPCPLPSVSSPTAPRLGATPAVFVGAPWGVTHVVAVDVLPPSPLVPAVVGGTAAGAWALRAHHAATLADAARAAHRLCASGCPSGRHEGGNGAGVRTPPGAG